MRADRVVSMMLLLQARGRMSAAALARELEVSRRTVMRDLDALGAAGIPVFSTRGPDGGFEIWEGFRSVLRTVSTEEAAALTLLGSDGAAVALGLADELLRARLKMEHAMTQELADAFSGFDSRVHIDTSTSDEVRDVLRFLVISVRGNRAIRTRIGRQGETELEPLGLVHSGGQWHLVATDVDSGSRVVHPVEELAGYGTTGRKFDRPEGFDVATHWKESRPQGDSS